MKRKRRLLNNIYTKLLIVLLCIAIIPSVLASILSYQVSIGNAKKQSEAYSRQLLAEMVSANDTTFQQMQAFIYEIMMNFNFYGSVLSKVPYSAAYLDVRSELDRKRQAYQNHIKNFALVDLRSQRMISSVDGIAVYEFDDFRSKVDAKLMDMIFNPDANDVPNDLVLRRTSKNESVLTYIARYGLANNVSGYIAVDIDAAKLTRPDASGQYGYLFVRNSHGMLLTDRNKDVYEAAHASGTTDRYVVISQKSSVSDLQYEYVVSKATITKNNRILLWSILSICLVLIILGALAAWMSSNNIYNPLRELLRYLRNLSGDRTQPEPAARLNEINYLEQLFNRMNHQNQTYMKTIRMNQGMFKQRQLSCLLTGNVSGFAQLEVPEPMRIAFPHDSFVCFAIELEDVADFKQKFTPLEQELMYYSIENIAEESFGSRGVAVAGRQEPYRIAVLLNYDAARNGQPELPVEWSRQVQSDLERYLHILVSIGISGSGAHMQAIKGCYDQAMHAVSHKAYFGKGSIVHDPIVAQMDTNREFDASVIPWNEIKDHLKISFRLNEWDRIIACIDEIIGKVSYVSVTPSDLQFVYLQYLSCLSDTCVEFSLQLQDVFGDRFYMDRRLARLSTMKEVHAQMAALARSLFEKLEEKKSHVHQEMIEKILVHIHAHIDRNLTIESIAEKVFMHPAYLSRICKTITGLSLGEQIVQAKIGKAKELLTGTQVTVGDIAERLGYTTPRAFYRIFKDYTGFTPSDYRKQEGLRKIIE
ncbi:AraC family transcriptional regulator [Paenibacillus lycopersici]|uniref:AraC family transcriptional regulator n=1 Tax=Paenibacillus lycopersici TaxID=2704462 RepID=A0A6C0G781_9BACL|nr:helix-turn-helix domain-containing protein [Paenibacillus lycopersici]QHT63215.1 AraC family transcriptional regulator [Paenibacillus lycopersici]